MDNSASSWFSQLGMEDPLSNDDFNIMDFLNDELSAAPADDFQNSSFPEGNPSFSNIFPSCNSTPALCEPSVMEAHPVGFETPAKQHKTNNGYDSSNIHNMPNFGQASSSPMILTFGNPNMPEINPHQVTLGTLNPEDDAVSEVLTSHGSFAKLDEAAKTTVQTKAKKPGGRVRPPSQTYDHIIAERKRREQLSQRFMALSAIVPGLKKMDKSSILGDAIEYLKHLQERVKTLEEKAARQTMESVVLVKRSQLLLEDEGSSDEVAGPNEQPLPEFEAKVCDKNVLLRIHCKNYKGVLIKILSQIDKLNLAVLNTCVSPFGNFALDITIIAEAEKEVNLTTKELVDTLRSVLQQGKHAA
nr:transcription factor bHLH18-like [Coffea arabica]